MEVKRPASCGKMSHKRLVSPYRVEVSIVGYVSQFLQLRHHEALHGELADDSLCSSLLYLHVVDIETNLITMFHAKVAYVSVGGNGEMIVGC